MLNQSPFGDPVLRNKLTDYIQSDACREACPDTEVLENFLKTGIANLNATQVSTTVIGFLTHISDPEVARRLGLTVDQSTAIQTVSDKIPDENVNIMLDSKLIR